MAVPRRPRRYNRQVMGMASLRQRLDERVLASFVLAVALVLTVSTWIVGGAG